MELIAVGLNHKTAPLSIREQLAIPKGRAGAIARALTNSPHIDEAMVLSTCNRVEIYAIARPACLGVREITRFLSELSSTPEKTLLPHLYIHEAEGALRHLFRVTSSLDSMVVGEPQITGQVKQAYQESNDHGAIQTLLHRSLHQAFKVAKRVRFETGIGEHAVSLSFLAVELARQIFDRLDSTRALLIGAGKMSALAARHLHHQGIAELVIANRSIERATDLANELGGVPKLLSDLPELLLNADIVISSTNATEFLITKKSMAKTLKARRHRPIFLIDLAVPRDIEPGVHQLENVYLYDVDDMQRVLRDNVAARQREALLAEKIIDAEVPQFFQRLRQLKVVPTIISMRERHLQLADVELARFMQRHGAGLTAAQKKATEAMVKGLVNKLLHAPTAHLKRAATTPEGPQTIDTVRALFDLESPEKASTESASSVAQAFGKKPARAR